MNTPILESKMNYPRFITDKPNGQDLFKGQSQNRIAENIVQFINENDDNSRKVIGIEGEWGSGKSNVIEILKNKLRDNYYFFVFDAWGHQEDLTRRSILEELLTKLIDDGQLTGEQERWKKELKTLLSKTIDTEKKSIPKVSPGLILSFIGILLTLITKIIVENYLKAYTHAATQATPESTPNFGNYLFAIFILLIPFIPLIFWILRAISKAEEGEKAKVIGELFYVYKGQEIINTSEETISENEPTVLQFTKFLARLEKGAKRKLVIVFDNMDRLPASKVKDIWSSIHTFFASDDYGLKTWAIVPFDNDHICNIFVEDGKDDKEGGNENHRADSYIHKTFSIVFHVSPPILSDWKNFFSAKFKEAFGYAPPPNQSIEIIFDYHHRGDPKIKPRDIICFVNDLVALNKLWGDEIEFKYFALFALKRDSIMKDPFAEIIGRSYLGTLKTFFLYDKDLETNISALAFNVPKTEVDEIILRNPIQDALNGQGDFLSLCNHKSFFDILDSVYFNVPIYDVTRVVSLLNELPANALEGHDMRRYWESLSNSLYDKNFSPEFVSALKILIRKLKDKKRIEKVLSYIFKRSIEEPENNITKSYWGPNYQKLVIDLESILKEVWPEKDIQGFLLPNHVPPMEYIEFIKECPDDIEKCKILCDKLSLNQYLFSDFDSNYFSLLPWLKILNSKIDLTLFKNRIEELIPNLNIDFVNAKPFIISNIFEIGKALSENGKALYSIPENIALELLNITDSNDRCAIDLLLSILKTRINGLTSETKNNEIYNEMLQNLDLSSEFCRSYSYYFIFSDLIKYNLQFLSPLTNSVMILEIRNPNALINSNIDLLINNYIGIKTNMLNNDPELCDLFISKINNNYSAVALSFATDHNLYNVIKLISDNYVLQNAVISDAIQQSKKYVIDLEKNVWVSYLKDSANSANCQLLSLLIEKNIFDSDKLPTNVNSAYFEVLRSISKKETSIPTDIAFWNKLFEIHGSNITSTLMDIRDELLDRNHGLVSIEELTFFEACLFQNGILNDVRRNADDSLRRIFGPLASTDENYISILRRNTEGVKKIIEIAHDSVNDFKMTLEAKCPVIFEDSTLRLFTEALIGKVSELKSATNAGEEINV